MFVMDCYGHKLSNGVLFAHHLILDVPGGSSHLGYRRRVPPGHYPHMRVKLSGISFTPLNMGTKTGASRRKVYQNRPFGPNCH